MSSSYWFSILDYQFGSLLSYLISTLTLTISTNSILEANIAIPDFNCIPRGSVMNFTNYNHNLRAVQFNPTINN